MYFMEYFSNPKVGRIQPLKGRVIEFCINNSVKCGTVPCTSFKIGLNIKMFTLLFLVNIINSSSNDCMYSQKQKNQISFISLTVVVFCEVAMAHIQKQDNYLQIQKYLTYFIHWKN